MFEHLNFRVNFNNADYSNLSFSYEDRKILKQLGTQVADIATRSIMKDRRNLWTNHNKLQKTRPLVLCDPENGWNELITENQIKCSNDIARHWECHLRKQIFWGNEMNDDYVVEPYFNLPYKFRDTQWGIKGSAKTQTIKKTAEQGKAYHIETILEDFSQIENISKPELDIDYKTTEILLDLANEIFRESLEARVNTVWFWSFGLTDDLVFMRGLEKLMYDFLDEPEPIHELMKILRNGIIDRLNYLEGHNLLCLNNDSSFVGSGGLGYTDELPAVDYSGRVRIKDMWGLAESQVTIGISPDMFREFIFPYQRDIMEMFGLTCYGCCEPMDARFDIVKVVPNLRRVSVSPWANSEIMAGKLKHNYIYSLKPSPSHLAVSKIDEDAIRNDINRALKITKENCVELIMKDNHTLGNNPENIKNWVRIAREEIDSI